MVTYRLLGVDHTQWAGAQAPEIFLTSLDIFIMFYIQRPNFAQ